MRLVRTHLHLHLHGAVLVPALSLLGWLTLRSLKGEQSVMGRRDNGHGGVLTVLMMWEWGQLRTVVRGQCGGG